MASNSSLCAHTVSANTINAGTVSSRKSVEAVSAATTLTQADSGKVFNINQASVYAITLPTATTAAEALQLVGWHATFIAGTVAGNNVTIVRGEPSNDSITGAVASHVQDGLTGVTIGSHVITFAATDCDVGDSVDVVCVAATESATTYLARGFAAT